MKIYFLFVKESYGHTNGDRKYELAESDRKKKRKRKKNQNDKQPKLMDVICIFSTFLPVL